MNMRFMPARLLPPAPPRSARRVETPAALMRERLKTDWFKFRVRFVLGACLGAIGGLGAWGRSDYAQSASFLPGLLFVSGGALLCGLLAACLADDVLRA